MFLNDSSFGVCFAALAMTSGQSVFARICLPPKQSPNRRNIIRSTNTEIRNKFKISNSKCGLCEDLFPLRSKLQRSFLNDSRIGDCFVPIQSRSLYGIYDAGLAMTKVYFINLRRLRSASVHPVLSNRSLSICGPYVLRG